MNLVKDTKIGSIEEEEASLAPEVHQANEKKEEVKAEAPKVEEKKEEAPKKEEAKTEETAEVPVAEAPAKKGKVAKTEKKKEAEKKVVPPKFIEESVVDENIAKSLVDAFGVSADDAKAIIAKVKESLNQQISNGEPTVAKGYKTYVPVIWNGMKFTRMMPEESKSPFREIREGETFWVLPFWQTTAVQVIADVDKTVYQFNHTSKSEGYECSNLQIRKYDEKGKPFYEAVADEDTKKKIFGLFAEFHARVD
jgi:hypothetical protein